MDVQLNLAASSGVFAAPNAIVQSHLKLASHAALKVILALYQGGTAVEEADLCRTLGLTSVELNEALLYWEQAGLLTKTVAPVEAKAVAPSKPKATVRQVRATRSEIAKRASESREIALVLQQAEIKFARPLKEIEKGTIVYLLDDLGVKAELVLMLLEFAVAQGRTTASFLESTAVDWVNRGVDSVASAEHEMMLADQKKHAWTIVKRAMSIEDRRPSPKESEMSLRWVEEWQFSEAMLRTAYDQCVDAIGKMHLPYIDKILTSWHNGGAVDAKAATGATRKGQTKKPTETAPSFDLSRF